MTTPPTSQPQPDPGAPHIHHPLAERIFESIIFSSRWLLAPFYLGLALSLMLLLGEFVNRTYELFNHGLSIKDDVIVGVLSLIDLSLTGNLVLMVIFAGYENFVSKIDVGDHKDKPEWMGHVGFGDLKLKLMTSIVAISAIHVLEDFMNIERMTDRDLAWAVGIHMSFIISGVLLAVMERLSHK